MVPITKEEEAAQMGSSDNGELRPVWVLASTETMPSEEMTEFLWDSQGMKKKTLSQK